jgi:hypothetical protein
LLGGSSCWRVCCQCGSDRGFWVRLCHRGMLGLLEGFVLCKCGMDFCRNSRDESVGGESTTRDDSIPYGLDR